MSKYTGKRAYCLDIIIETFGSLIHCCEEDPRYCLQCAQDKALPYTRQGFLEIAEAANCKYVIRRIRKTQLILQRL